MSLNDTNYNPALRLGALVPTANMSFPTAPVGPTGPTGVTGSTGATGPSGPSA